jgi:hypothetical protein
MADSRWFAQRSKLTFTVSVLLVISVLLADSLFDVSAWPYRLDDIMNRAMAFPICVSLMLVFYYAEKICKGKTSPVKSWLRRYLMGIKKINQKKIITFVVWNSPSYYY